MGTRLGAENDQPCHILGAVIDEPHHAPAAPCDKLHKPVGRQAHPEAIPSCRYGSLYTRCQALALLFRAPPAARDTAADVLDVLGLGSLTRDEPAPPDVVALADERQAARDRRDFAESDRLRDDIGERGWEVRDGGRGGFELYPRDG